MLTWNWEPKYNAHEAHEPGKGHTWTEPFDELAAFKLLKWHETLYCCNRQCLFAVQVGHYHVCFHLASVEHQRHSSDLAPADQLRLGSAPCVHPGHLLLSGTLVYVQMD